VIPVTLRRPGGADPLVDNFGNLQHPIPTVHPDSDRVAHSDGGGRLGDGTIDRHMSAFARLGGHGSGFEGPHRPQPPIDSGAVHR
jgi:hypothetical protein